MLENILASFLNSSLGKYVHNLASENLEYSLLNGKNDSYGFIFILEKTFIFTWAKMNKIPTNKTMYTSQSKEFKGEVFLLYLYSLSVIS